MKYFLIWFNTFFSDKFSLKEPFNIEKIVILINLINEIENRNSQKIIEKQIICPHCGSEDLFADEERAELVCNKCGLVIENNLADISELNEFINKQTYKIKRNKKNEAFSSNFMDSLEYKELKEKQDLESYLKKLQKREEQTTDNG